MLDRNLVNRWKKAYQQLEKEILAIDDRLAEIEKLGWTTATLSTRPGHNGIVNYYLIHSIKSDWVAIQGKSRFEYIGAKPEKIAEAKARKARYTERQELRSKRWSVYAKLQTVTRLSAQISSHLLNDSLELFSFSQPENVAVNGHLA